MFFAIFEQSEVARVKSFLNHRIGALTEQYYLVVHSTDDRHSFANVVEIEDVKNVVGLFLVADAHRDGLGRATLFNL